jgi:acyl-CoA synthetase (AMP-forming)/AMP-acid ligase II/aryl carrier-like protein
MRSTKVLPFQELFIRQQLALGTACSNQLIGIAEIRNVQLAPLKKAIEEVLKTREWPYLTLDKSLSIWEKSDKLNGYYILDEKASPMLSFDGLWSINLYQENRRCYIKLSMHHVLADAHSFQLFWNDIKQVYAGQALSEEGSSRMDCPAPSVNIPLGNIKPFDPIGIGPIERITLDLSPTRKRLLNTKCRELKLNLSTVLFGCLQYILDDLEHHIGMPIQTGMALRNRSGKIAKKTFLTQVNFLPIPHFPMDQMQELELAIKHTFRHQDFPLLDWLKQEKRSTAFNALFSYQKESYQSATDELTANFTFLPASVDENILSMHVLEFDEELMSVSFDVRTDIANQSFWRKLIKEYINVVVGFLKGTILKISYPAAYLKPKTNHAIPLWDIFNATEGDKKAIVCGTEVVTFDALKARVDARGPMRQHILFLKPHRTIDTLVAILSQWRHGGLVSFIEPFEFTPPEGDFLYLAETSGSTGEPKRMLIQRRGIQHMLPSWKQRLKIESDAIHLSLADMRFDVFFGDLFRSLFLGNTLILATEEERLSPSSILALIDQNRVTHLESTPSMLQLILKSSPTFKVLKHLICGSEPMNSSLFTALKPFDGLSVYNSYGLTEVSIDTALTPLNEVNHQFPLGQPLGDQQLSIRNPEGTYLPMGTWGELYIEGSAVAWPMKLTDQYYKNNDWFGYKTGDRALIHPVYGLIVAGRIQDDFIKVNGKRIPAVRIQQLVVRMAQLAQCCVLSKDGLSILLHNLSIADELIREELIAHLPVYQIPDIIQYCDEWPVNQNGKIDKKQLAATLKINHTSSPKWEPNHSEKEQIIYRVLTTFEKSYGSSYDSLLIFGWNSIDLLSLCNELMLNGISVAPQQLMANPCLDTILMAEESKVSPAKTEEIDIYDLDMDDILGILNR